MSGPPFDSPGIADAERERIDAIRRRGESPQRYIEYQMRTGEVLLGHVRRFLPEPRGARVLELGCGSAGIAMALSRGGMRAHAIDNQQYDSPLGAAHDYALAHAIPLDLARADAARLPYRDASFTCVVASSVIEHLDDPERTLREIARVLTGSGMAFIDFPLFRGPYGGHIDDVIAWPWFHLLPDRIVSRRLERLGATRELAVYRSLNRMTLRAFRRMVRGSGLRVRESRRLNFLTHPGRKLAVSLLEAARRMSPAGAARAVREAFSDFSPSEAAALPLLLAAVPLSRVPLLEEWTVTGMRYVLEREP
jgi:ubiquinone/menaquinone biosynthesis C-methylase UbiE